MWRRRNGAGRAYEAPPIRGPGGSAGGTTRAGTTRAGTPVGTDAGHTRRGFGAAVSLACLHAMREAGATLAVVCPRGDQAYPVPRVLYHRLGFRDAGRTVTYAD
jgi:hypothetical protein